jgi:thiol-disulfide isomerase/thioredoxin
VGPAVALAQWVNTGLSVGPQGAARLRSRSPLSLTLEFCGPVLLCLLGAAGYAQQGVTDLEGRQADPWAAASGKLVVLVFVRTDCPISNRYAPTIQRLSAQYADRARFWLVYPDKDETPASIRKYLHDYGYKLPALRDPRHSLVKLSQAHVTPEVAVFSADGQLFYHGRIDNWYESFGHARPAPTTHDLDDALRATLAGKSVAPNQVGGVGCYISDLE